LARAVSIANRGRSETWVGRDARSPYADACRTAAPTSARFRNVAVAQDPVAKLCGRCRHCRRDVVRSRRLPARPIDEGCEQPLHACMPRDLRATERSALHMPVLGRIAPHAAADAQDIAGWLGVPVAVAEALCAGAGSRGPCHARRRPLTSCGQVVDEGSTAT